MGFDTYKDFQRYLHELSVIVATPLDLMKDSNKSNNTNSGITGHVWLDDALKNLRTLRNSLDPSQLERLAKQIYSAERIFDHRWRSSLIPRMVSRVQLPAPRLAWSGKMVFTVLGARCRTRTLH